MRRLTARDAKMIVQDPTVVCVLRMGLSRLVGILGAVILFALVSGCSEQGGFHIVPEHKDIGVISSKDRTAVVEFKVVNGLDVPVTVEKIFPSCTCTSVRLKKNPVPAGESTTLQATVDVSMAAGRQSYVVTLETDHPSYPIKRVTFDALAPAMGTRKRHLSLGVFYPGAKINVELPMNSVTLGAIKPQDDKEKASGITARPLTGRNGVAVFKVEGTAPSSPGVFSEKFQYLETISGDTTSSEGEFELELSGSVVARWAVQREYYCGFVNLRNEDSKLSLGIGRNTTSSVDSGSDVSRVLVTSTEEWLSVEGQSVADGIQLNATIRQNKVTKIGPVEVSIEVQIEYTDGHFESYSSKLFVHIARS